MGDKPAIRLVVHGVAVDAEKRCDLGDCHDLHLDCSHKITSSLALLLDEKLPLLMKLDVMFSAEPARFERLAVILVMSFRFRVSTDLTRTSGDNAAFDCDLQFFASRFRSYATDRFFSP